MGYSPFKPKTPFPTLSTWLSPLFCLCDIWAGEGAQSCPTLCNPWTVAYQAPQSMEFSRRAYWSGLPFPSPGDLPEPGIEPRSPTLQADTLPSKPPGKPMVKPGQTWAGKSLQIWLSISLTWNNFFSDFSLWYFLLLDIIRRMEAP